MGQAEPVVENHITVAIPDGEAECYVAHPVSGRQAAVVIWPEIFGKWPAFRQVYNPAHQGGNAGRIQPLPGRKPALEISQSNRLCFLKKEKLPIFFENAACCRYGNRLPGRRLAV